ncbi:MAG: TolC family protein [Bacteroidota bacterium]
MAAYKQDTIGYSYALYRAKATMLFICFLINASYAQKIWSLEDCLERAIQENIGIQQAAIETDIATLNVQQQRNSIYPTIESFSNLGMQFGRTIDPTTNAFANQEIAFQSIGINLAWQLPLGGKYRHQLAEANHLLNANEAKRETAIYDLKIQMVQTYLSVLLAEEKQAQAQLNLEQQEQHLQELKKLVEFGTKAEADLLEVQYQLAQRVQVLVEANAALATSVHRLQTILNLPNESTIVLKRPRQDLLIRNEHQLNEAEMAETTHPQLKMATAKWKAAEASLSATDADKLPS